MDVALRFLIEHVDLIELLFEAVTGGVSKERIVDQIKSEIVEASRERMRKELGG